MLRSSLALALVAGWLLVPGVAQAGCMEEIPGICVHDVRDECPLVHPIC